MLKIKEVRKKFSDFLAIEKLNVTIEEGTVFGLIGANGAGKTTTFRMILGLLEPTEGEILWKEEKIDYKKSSMIGYLPEERGLYPKVKVLDQLIYLGRLRGIPKRKVIEEAEKWFHEFKIPGYLKSKVNDLSKGNQQKVQFIASIIHQPKLLILDEPFTGLDPINVEMMKKAVIKLKENGTTILFSSHRLDHVEELCESICMIKNGKIIENGKIEDIKKGYERNKVILRTDIKEEKIKEIKEIKGIASKNKEYQLMIENEKDVRKILEKLLLLGEVTKFELKEPTLEEIFIKKIGDHRD